MGKIFLDNKPYDPNRVFFYYHNKKEIFRGETLRVLDQNGDYFITIDEVNKDIYKFISLYHQASVLKYVAENLEAAKGIRKKEEQEWRKEVDKLDPMAGAKY